MSDVFAITSGVCETCGTEVLRDEETGAEVHRDVTYERCGVEGELTGLLDHIEGRRPARHLRVVQ